MSNYNSLKTTINANVKQNGNQEITGQILNSVLNQMVTTLGTGYQFAGVATTATDPGSPDAKVFYIANGKGTYTNFGGLEVTEDDVIVLYWDSSWHKVSTGIASQEKLSELEGEINGILEYKGSVNVREGVDNQQSQTKMSCNIPAGDYHISIDTTIIKESGSVMIYYYDESDTQHFLCYGSQLSATHTIPNIIALSVYAQSKDILKTGICKFTFTKKTNGLIDKIDESIIRLNNIDLKLVDIDAFINSEKYQRVSGIPEAALKSNYYIKLDSILNADNEYHLEVTFNGVDASKINNLTYFTFCTIQSSSGWKDNVKQDVKDNIIIKDGNAVAKFIYTPSATMSYLFIAFGTPYTFTDEKVKVDILNEKKDENDRYNGQVWSALGDSMTYAGVYEGIVQQKLQLSKYSNYGMNGTPMSGSSEANAMHQTSRIEQLDMDADVVTIFAGTNDCYQSFYQEHPTENAKGWGELSLNNSDTATFIGAYNVCLSKIFYKYCKCAPLYSNVDYSGITQVSEPINIGVLIVTPPHAFDASHKGVVDKVAGFVREIASMWGIPVVDVNAEVGFNECNKHLLMSQDNLHPNTNGYIRIGNMISIKAIQSILV